jgi:hypothetical protein
VGGLREPLARQELTSMGQELALDGVGGRLVVDDVYRDKLEDRA